MKSYWIISRISIYISWCIYIYVVIFVLGSRWNSWFWTSWWRRGAWLCWLMVHACGTIRDGERWEERMLLKETNVAAESCAACHKCNFSFIFCRGILTGLRRPSTEQDLHGFTRRCCIRFGCHTHTHTHTQAHVCVSGCCKVSWLIKALRCRTEDVTCAAQWLGPAALSS